MELDALLATEPENAAALLKRAQLLAVIGLPDEALADLTRVGAPTEATSEHVGLRGRLVAALNRQAEALADLNRAIELGNADPLVYAARGSILLSNGNGEQARSEDRDP